MLTQPIRVHQNKNFWSELWSVQICIDLNFSGGVLFLVYTHARQIRLVALCFSSRATENSNCSWSWEAMIRRRGPRYVLEQVRDIIVRLVHGCHAWAISVLQYQFQYLTSQEECQRCVLCVTCRNTVPPLRTEKNPGLFQYFPHFYG